MESATTLFKLFSHHDVRELLFAHIDLKGANNLFFLNREYHNLLATETGRKSLENKIKQGLLNAVVHADWQLAQKIVKAFPEYMFSKINSKDLDGSIIFISPLEYACRVCDEHMIMIFRNAVKQEDWRKFYDILHSYFDRYHIGNFKEDHQSYFAAVDSWLRDQITIDELQKFVCEYSAALNAKTNFFAIGILQVIYGGYSYQMYQRRNEHTLVTTEKLNEYWKLIIGHAQRFIAPRHMLKQMCAYYKDRGPHHDWFNQSDFNFGLPSEFNAKNTPTSANIDDVINAREDFVLGKDFAFAYAHGDLRAEPSSQMSLPIGEFHPNVWVDPGDDYVVFYRLMHMRAQHIHSLMVDLEYEFGIKNDFDTKFSYMKRHEPIPFVVREPRSKCAIM